MGLGYLAAVAKNLNYSVQIIDGNYSFQSINDLAEKIISLEPKFLGITATTLTIDTAAEIAKLVKVKLSKVIAMVGGAHVTAVSKEVLKRYKAIDIGVIGEGEETLTELLPVLEKGKSLRKIKGIVFRNKKKIITNPPREFLKNLDRLPYPAWDLIYGFPERYSPAVNFLYAASRCTSFYFPGMYREMSILR